MKKISNRIVVIKVGTSTLTKKNHKGELELDSESFDRIGNQVTVLRKGGYSVAIVSSAAITAGMMVTHLTKRPSNDEVSMPTLQGLASIGWRHVLNMWSASLGDAIAGELLITRHELELDSERSELLKVSHNLMVNDYVPIINENDAVTHEQIAFGDNDTLAATYAAKLKQSELFGDDVSLIVLSDIDGVYENIDDPKTLISRIEDIDAYEHFASGVVGGVGVGTGGMSTKFAAARISKKSGVTMYIANGRRDEILLSTINGETGTRFDI